MLIGEFGFESQGYREKPIDIGIGFLLNGDKMCVEADFKIFIDAVLPIGEWIGINKSGFCVFNGKSMFHLKISFRSEIGTMRLPGAISANGIDHHGSGHRISLPDQTCGDTSDKAKNGKILSHVFQF